MPAGAIPKDGPSAGVTMVTALASLLTGRPVKHTVGMTGEVTLQGRVLPIGGLKQKVLAAHAAGLTDVILPERNRGDLDDIPEEVREQMSFHPVMTIHEVLDRALEPAARCRAVVGASRSPRRSGRARTSWSGAGSSRSSTPRSRGALRFNEFADAVVGHLAADALGAAARPRGGGPGRAHRDPLSPPTVEYRLTERGRRLAPVIEAMPVARAPV